MNVLGVDLSLKNTGWCLINGNKKIIEVGSFGYKPKSGAKANQYLLDRLSYMEDELIATIEFLPIDHVGIEHYANPFGRGVKSLLPLVEWGGIAKNILAQNTVVDAIYTISPPSIKKCVTGKGNAKKDEVAKAIKAQSGYAFDTDDEADAYAIALSTLEILNGNKDVKHDKLEVKR